LDRGRVEVNIVLQGDTSTGVLLQVNMDLARQYHRCLEEVKSTLELGGEVTIADMLGLRDLISHQEEGLDLEKEWIVLEKALSLALDECDRMREQEGQTLKQDLRNRLQAFSRLVRTIESNVPDIVQGRTLELKARIEKLLTEVDLDPARLAQEAAFMADKADVTEEIVRLRSHIDQFETFLGSNEPVGRRLDFLLQEFLREVNTLASKISNGTVAHLGVEMKNEIEKLREQVQNIE
ncbi:MAG TPA: YicC family protein, partial [Desulfobulbaceae bacterium]|nr:YicC family protein [Desulfobulbaceae bacterium]